MTPIEVTVKVSDDDQTLSNRFLHYPQEGGLGISRDDPRMAYFVEESLQKFKGVPTDVVVKIKFVW